ncbi:MAG: type I pullulanase, partial [Erysipelotrichaceae bacterium]
IVLKHDNDEGIIVKNELGEVQSIKMFLFAEGSNATSSSSFTLFLNNDLDLNHRYTITRTGYNTIPITFNKVYTSAGFTEAYTYTGVLGATYTKPSTTFRLWAPTADSVILNLFTAGDGGTKYEADGKAGQTLNLIKGEKGLWELVLDGDYNKVYYTYSVSVNGLTNEAVDPYAKAVGVNGNRGMVIDLDTTDPSGWAKDKTLTLVNNTDAIIYEIHVRDFSSYADSGISNKGKFLAFTETGTVNKDGLPTGLDHLVELGITHVHLLPSFDFRTVDETTLEENNFNWGYDPQNYNVPEGSYSTDPYNGEVRINEFKQIVMALHSKKIGVIMDVVYNHTSLSASSDFSKIVPGYYYRYTADGKFSNGSGTGNETASERSMVRKFIIDSVSYWATEYHIDGFRFDLMGLHDIETMKQVKDALEAINPSILVYGEGWTGGSSTLAVDNRSVKINVSKLNDIAVFSDDIRDAIKGNVFIKADKGFVNGEANMEESVKFGIVASIQHGQVKFPVKYSKYAYATSPTQVVTYVESHDNLTLWDKLLATNPEATEAERIAMVRLAYGILLTSQGITFMQAGDDFLRSKGGNDNSYNAT